MPRFIRKTLELAIVPSFILICMLGISLVVHMIGVFSGPKEVQTPTIVILTPVRMISKDGRLIMTVWITVAPITTNKVANQDQFPSHPPCFNLRTDPSDPKAWLNFDDPRFSSVPRGLSPKTGPDGFPVISKLIDIDNATRHDYDDDGVLPLLKGRAMDTTSDVDGIQFKDRAPTISLPAAFHRAGKLGLGVDQSPAPTPTEQEDLRGESATPSEDRLFHWLGIFAGVVFLPLLLIFFCLACVCSMREPSKHERKAAKRKRELDKFEHYLAVAKLKRKIAREKRRKKTDQAAAKMPR